MKRTTIALLVLMMMLTGLTSCDPARMYDDYRDIPEMNWHKDSLMVFDIPVTDTLQNHNILVQIRHDIEYKYSNLWLFIEIVQPNGEVLSDTLEIALAEPSGSWMGRGNGSLRTVQKEYRQHIYFPVSGNYRITLKQGMRDEQLKGVHDIGVRIERASGGE